ncbi:pentatricopeptide repeat-containing protein At2g13600-like [Magnolia sinica]|uniref:pentatricopeptide repeat-containing protein At2g13600-like n=1 Tax=Magnolia sinica TaxID=86752 RepID=UPI00265876EB|nr:pentatricopeptide repeat-containing protein At2g13600-like [Magnolia sinica]
MLTVERSMLKSFGSSSLKNFKVHTKGIMSVHANFIKTSLILDPSIQTDLLLFYLKSDFLVHARIMFDEMHHRNPIVESAMISALSKVGRTSDARRLFESIKDPDVACWNAMISGYARNSYDPEGLKLFAEFQISATDPNEFTLSNIFSFCRNVNALEEGKQIHAFVIKKRLATDVAASNSLINLYFKCGCVDDAEQVLARMPEKDVYTWTAMVSGYAQNGRIEEATAFFEAMPWRNTVSWNSIINAHQQEGNDIKALELFGKMVREGELPNKSTFATVLKGCATLQDLDMGKGVHCRAMKSAKESDVFVGSTLVDMYAKCGDLADAQLAFDEITGHSVVSWSVLLAGYLQNGELARAVGIFIQMPEKNVVSWNVMIAGHVQNGLPDNAFVLFIDMIKAGEKPNHFTLSSLLSGCSSPQYTKKGKKLHGYTVKTGFESDTSIGNSLITMYGEQRKIKDALLVFQFMPQHDVVSWTAAVAAHITNQETDGARRIFDRMPWKNLITWNTMIFGYLQNGKTTTLNPQNRMEKLSHSVEDALVLFYDMERSEIKPDHFTYNCALSACASIGALQRARSIHAKTINRGFEVDVGVANALITIYGKCGNLSDAEKIFNGMTKPDTISWNALITGYAQNGLGEEVLELYDRMQKSGIDPNHVTYISILSACSYMGLVEKGKEYFYGMSRDHGITPTKDHYACMVDLLGRAGCLHEAEDFIINMPIKPDSVVWGALLGACKIHGDPVVGRRAAEEIFCVEPENSAAYIMLSNIFAAVGMWEDVAKVRTAMKEKRLVKEPGCSWIEILGCKHSFLARDRCQSQTDSVYAALWSLYSNMTEEGYVHDSGIIALDLDD